MASKAFNRNPKNCFPLLEWPNHSQAALNFKQIVPQAPNGRYNLPKQKIESVKLFQQNQHKQRDSQLNGSEKEIEDG